MFLSVVSKENLWANYGLNIIIIICCVYINLLIIPNYCLYRYYM